MGLVVMQVNWSMVEYNDFLVLLKCIAHVVGAGSLSCMFDLVDLARGHRVGLYGR
jgi:hypothetical protein